MIQVIAVHSVGTMPRAMELDTSRLDFVQAHALRHLPRAPSGVPELRALGKGDGEVSFRFKVPPEKLSPTYLPEMLTLWDAKFTDATLKLIAKNSKAEREAASAAGLWKNGSDKHDLNAMHAQCTPAQARDFTEALATVVQKKKAPAKLKRLAKPKELASVVAATSDIDPVTGERKDKVSASVSAVATMRAREIVKSMGGAAEQGEQFADPLELARLQDTSQQGQGGQAEGSEQPQTLASQPASSLETDIESAPQLEGNATSVAKPAPEGRADKAIKAIERHKSGQGPGPRLIEMDVQDLFKRLDQDRPNAVPSKKPDAAVAPAAAPAPVAGALQVIQAAAAVENAGEQASSYDAFDGFDAPGFGEQYEVAPLGGPEFPPDDVAYGEFEHPVALGADSLPYIGEADAVHGGVGSFGIAAQMEQVESAAPVQRTLDWSGLSSFRLLNQLNQAQALVLPTGEMFEALAHVQILEPLAVQVEWLQDAARESDVALPEQERLGFATDWMCKQLAWRSKALTRWLGRADLVSPEGRVAAPETTKAKHRPAGWVSAAMDMAVLAQQISMDIAMLEQCAREIDRALSGMPSWAIEAMQQMRAFETQQSKILATDEKPDPRVAFRDSWRAELLRIDRWCGCFKHIRIARQFGLFGSAADQKLLLRLELLINRTKDWQRAPAQASRVLAVWLAFVLSLDHSAIASRPAPETRPPAQDKAGVPAQQKELSHA